MEKRIALFDLDGTLADYTGAMKRDMEKIECPEESIDSTDPLSWRDPDKAEYLGARESMIEKQPGWWLELEVIEAGKKIFDLAQKLGFEAQVLTKGPQECSAAWGEKHEWCKKHLGVDPLTKKDIKVTITREKAQYYGHVLVDDYWKFMEPWLKVRPRALGLMPRTESNKDKSHDHMRHYNDKDLDEKQVEKFLIFARDRKEGEPTDYPPQ